MEALILQYCTYYEIAFVKHQLTTSASKDDSTITVCYNIICITTIHQNSRFKKTGCLCTFHHRHSFYEKCHHSRRIENERPLRTPAEIPTRLVVAIVSIIRNDDASLRGPKTTSSVAEESVFRTTMVTFACTKLSVLIEKGI